MHDKFSKVRRQIIRSLERVRKLGKHCLTALVAIISLFKGLKDNVVRGALLTATTLHEVEEIMAPFSNKGSSTLAGRAREQGLLPLANRILSGEFVKMTSKHNVNQNLPIEKGVRAILADIVANNNQVSALAKAAFQHGAKLLCKPIKNKKVVLKPADSYDNFECHINQMKCHQILAIARQEREKELTVSIELVQPYKFQLKKDILSIFCGQVYKGLAPFMAECVQDALKRLILPRQARHTRRWLMEKATEESIECFSQNLR